MSSIGSTAGSLLGESVGRVYLAEAEQPVEERLTRSLPAVDRYSGGAMIEIFLTGIDVALSWHYFVRLVLLVLGSHWASSLMMTAVAPRSTRSRVIDPSSKCLRSRCSELPSLSRPS